ncbi:lipase [Rhizobium sp. Root149]|uniref:Acetyl esterase/lipase n=1 Tax=Rhizobium rhizoryzae TaxID=451876 RepID=A0A7W6LIV1_9HYPH|nr:MULTISPECIES: alpha/beta hydrolase [Rhizobium]KQZ48935.1 lipase [Rhizobium sp. Root149]MBB4144947.1 acetyl esterase/lipase [Rhizobium rhizoryzae]
MTDRWENIGVNGPLTPPIPMRLYGEVSKTKGAPIVLYFRGDAFQGRSMSQAERPVGTALVAAGATVIEADYARGSDNRFPQAMEHAFMALAYLSTKRKLYSGMNKSLLFVAGEEAGGNIAAGVALKARDVLPGDLSGQLLLSPMIDPMMTSESFRRADEIGMARRWAEGWSHYLGNACGSQHPYAAPCICSRLSGVAPALVVTSDDDPLHDEVDGYADRLAASGVSVTKKIFPPALEWPDVYRGESGRWMDVLRDEFANFVHVLSE